MTQWDTYKGWNPNLTKMSQNKISPGSESAIKTKVRSAYLFFS